MDSLRVEAVGGFVEDQHRRVAEQRRSEREPLFHPKRVRAHPAARGFSAKADLCKSIVDPGYRVPRCPGDDAEMVTAGTPRVKRVGFEHRPHGVRRIGEIAVAGASDARSSVIGAGEVKQDLHGRRLP